MNLLVLPRDQVQFLFELLVATAVTRGLHILFLYSYVIANDAQRASSAFSCVRLCACAVAINYSALQQSVMQ